MAILYRLQNKVTGHYYLGICYDGDYRLSEHRRDIARGDKPKKWHNAWKKHPELQNPSIWEIVVIEERSTLEEVATLENKLLQNHVGRPMCLNMRRTGTKQGGMTENSRDLIREANKRRRGMKYANQNSTRRGIKMKKWSPETRAKVSASRAAKRYVKKFFEWLEHTVE